MGNLTDKRAAKSCFSLLWIPRCSHSACYTAQNQLSQWLSPLRYAAPEHRDHVAMHHWYSSVPNAGHLLGEGQSRPEVGCLGEHPASPGPQRAHHPSMSHGLPALCFSHPGAEEPGNVYRKGKESMPRIQSPLTNRQARSHGPGEEAQASLMDCSITRCGVTGIWH